MKPGPGAMLRLLRISAGLLVWSSGFVVLYAGYSLGCQQLEIDSEAGLGNPVTLSLVGITALHLAALSALLVQWRMRPIKPMAGESERSLGLNRWLEGFALFISMAGLLFIAFPILMVPPCAG